MSRISDAFKAKKGFVGFLTAGDPSLEKTKEYILAMERGGATVIELGVPFSDPVAEGPVIQEASLRALTNGCTLPKIFELITEVRKETDIPIVLLTYANPAFNYGYDAFCAKCKETGVDGLIVPDMPYEENAELKEFTDKHDLDLITLIAPTSKERITKLATDARGYVYLVSAMGVTGIREDMMKELTEFVNDIKKCTDTPVAVGFGIHTREQVEKYNEVADGVIVGSALVDLIAEYGENAAEALEKRVSELTGVSR